MSLIRLLSVGQSLDAHRANAARYQMRQENLLPDFSVKPGRRSAAMRNRQKVLSPFPKADSSVSAFVVREATDDGRPAQPGERLFRRVIQAELKLDTIKVVRNDLANDDWEIVCAERNSNPAGRPIRSLEPLSNSMNAPGFLSRVTRWFQAVRAIF